MDNEKDDYKMEETYNANLDFIWETSWDVFRHYHQPNSKKQIISLVDFTSTLINNLDTFYSSMQKVIPGNILPYLLLTQDENDMTKV